MNRRDVFKLSGSALAVTASLEAQTKPAATIAPAWKPEAMDAHQNDTLATLADLIIPDTDTPGARAANVHRYIDLLLRDGEDEQRRNFIAAISTVDGLAIDRHYRSFIQCSKEQQIAMLKAMDEGNEDGLPANAQMAFRGIKAMVARVYYNTQIGFKELNKGGRVPKSYACQA